MKNITLSVTDNGTIWVTQEDNPISTETKINQEKTQKENCLSALKFFFEAQEV